MPVDNYETLTTEVSRTNELLEEIDKQFKE